MSLAPPPPHLDDVARAAGRADAARRAADLADELARQEVRVSVALDLTVRAEERADLAAGAMVAAARRLAELGGAAIPNRSVDDDLPGFVHPAVTESDYLVRVRTAELRRRARGGAPTGRIERWAVGVVAFAGFLAVGVLAAVRGGVLPGDAVSRVQLALAVVAGRDPHPESIGFVWGPFPTVFEIPLVAVRSWWEPLASASVAAVVVSAAFMAATLMQLLAWARDCGAPRWVRLAVVALTVASPLVWTAGANGMSEAAWVFFLVLACRHLARWCEHDDVGSLVLTGVALGLAYLTRYETAAAIAVVIGLVLAVSWSRQRPELLAAPVGGEASATRRRARGAALDAAVLAFPAVAAVLGWAIYSWVITGEPFAQFTSQYGNAALVEAAARAGGGVVGDPTVLGRLWFFLQQVALTAPLLIPLVLLVLWIGDRAATRAAAALAVVGGPLALQLLLASRGQTFPWYRYVLAAVLLSALLVLVASGGWAWVRSHRWVRLVAVAMLVPGLLSSYAVVRGGSLGSEEEQRFASAVADGARGETAPVGESTMRRGADVAADVDDTPGVEPGAVLTDTSSTFAVVAAADRPEVYVIPSDRDFEAVVADPGAFGVRYLLLRTPVSPGDAVAEAHPGLVSDDDAAFEPVATWGDEGDRSGRYVLYRVLEVNGDPRPAPEQGFRP